ncbi:MAG: hypothetical protein ABI645_14675 [Pseudomonadota bacterium]
MSEQVTTGGETDCRSQSSMEALNRLCHCISVDQVALRGELESKLGGRGLSGTLLDTHPNLLAPLPVFISRAHLDEMACVVAAVDRLVATPLYRSTALGWAPAVAQVDYGPRGGLLGFDFHLGTLGPRLIEINTNPGGALLNALLLGAQQVCCSGAAQLASLPLDPAAVEQSLCDVLLAEWRMQRGGAALQSLAIVDESPLQQYLYPEFLLYQQALGRRGVHVLIADPHEIVERNGRLWVGDKPIDMVYNRLTDFALEHPAVGHLKAAYLAGSLVLSPNPRAHALYANKRNLCLLGDPAFLSATGADPDDAETLARAVPHTELVTDANRADLWARRRALFFKPVGGYGSKAAYRGDKITHRVWAEIAKREYIAQELVTPRTASERSRERCTAQGRRPQLRV